MFHFFTRLQEEARQAEEAAMYDDDVYVEVA